MDWLSFRQILYFKNSEHMGSNMVFYNSDVDDYFYCHYYCFIKKEMKIGFGYDIIILQ